LAVCESPPDDEAKTPTRISDVAIKLSLCTLRRLNLLFRFAPISGHDEARV